MDRLVPILLVLCQVGRFRLLWNNSILKERLAWDTNGWKGKSAQSMTETEERKGREQSSVTKGAYRVPNHHCRWNS